MLQYKIPQNVGLADKIVGPLTLRQLIIVAAGAGTSYVLFAILNKLYELNILEYIVIVLPVLIAVAAALIKIKDISLPRYALLTLEFAIKPKRRLWDHRGIAALVAPDLREKKTEKKAIKEAEKKRGAVNLDELSQVLDSGGFEHVETIEHKDIDSASDEDLMAEAFFGHKKETSETKNMYWRANRHDHGKRLELLDRLPRTVPKNATKALRNKRKRKRKAKNAGPVETRKDTQVQNVQKNRPVQFPATQEKKTDTPPPKKAAKSGELDLSPLHEDNEGDLIEINLD